MVVFPVLGKLGKQSFKTRLSRKLSQMKSSDNNSWSSFDVVHVFSKLYSAVYCSRENTEVQQSPTTTVEAGETPPSNEPPSHIDQRLPPPGDVDHRPPPPGHVDPQNRSGHSSRLPPSSPDSNHTLSIWLGAVREENLDYIRQLLEDGFPVNTVHQFQGWSALHLAAWNNNIGVCELLIHAQCDVNVRGEGECTPLALAAQRGNTNIIRQLIQANCDVNTTCSLADSQQVSPLHLAAQHGHAEVVQYLLDGGAVVNAAMTARGIDGVTPLHLAVQNDHLNIMDMLIASGCNVHSSTHSQDGVTSQPAKESTC